MLILYSDVIQSVLTFSKKLIFPVAQIYSICLLRLLSSLSRMYPPRTGLTHTQTPCRSHYDMHWTVSMWELAQIAARHSEVPTPSKQQWVLVNALCWSVAALVSLVNSPPPLANDSFVVGDVFPCSSKRRIIKIPALIPLQLFKYASHCFTDANKSCYLSVRLLYSALYSISE